MIDRLEWLNLYKDELLLLQNIKSVTICIGEPDMIEPNMMGRRAEYFEDSFLEGFYQGFIARANMSGGNDA